MQPNQQDPSRQPLYSPEDQGREPLGTSNIPEFLHLDPVVAQQPRASKKKIIVIAALFVILCGASGIAYWMYVQSRPDTLFYNAVSNAMSATIVKRELNDKESTQSGPFTATIDTDFSDGQTAKSHVLYSYDAPKVLNKNEKRNISLKGEIITKNDEGFYGRITALSQSQLVTSTIGRWYEVDKDSYKGASVFDSFHTQRELRALAPGLPLGDFSSDQRNAVVQYMQAKQVFKVNAVEESMYNNKPVKILTVESKSGDIIDLTSKLEETLKINLPELSLASDKVASLKVWIDDANRFVKVASVPGSDKEDLALHDETLISYPSTFSMPDVSAEKFALNFESLYGRLYEIAKWDTL